MQKPSRKYILYLMKGRIGGQGDKKCAVWEMNFNVPETYLKTLYNPIRGVLYKQRLAKTPNIISIFEK